MSWKEQVLLMFCTLLYTVFLCVCVCVGNTACTALMRGSTEDGVQLDGSVNMTSIHIYCIQFLSDSSSLNKDWFHYTAVMYEHV